jgi:hypothetical protein
MGLPKNTQSVVPIDMKHERHSDRHVGCGLKTPFDPAKALNVPGVLSGRTRRHSHIFSQFVSAIAEEVLSIIEFSEANDSHNVLLVHKERPLYCK